MRFVDPDGLDFWENVGRYVKGVGKGAYNTVRHPHKTAKKLGKAGKKGR